MQISFRVYGTPKPGGSKRGFLNRHTGRVQIVETCDNADWKTSVRLAAVEAMKGKGLLQGPLSLTILFYVPRPKSHFGKKGLKKHAPGYSMKLPDATKLLRSTEDAMTGIVWHDDAQVATQYVEKRYAVWHGMSPDEMAEMGSGARIRVYEIEPAKEVTEPNGLPHNNHP